MGKTKQYLFKKIEGFFGFSSPESPVFRLCVLLSESFGPYPDQNRLRGFVFKLPDLQLVLHKQLDSTQHIFPWGQRHRSPFFFLRSENPLTAVDIRTLEPFCEFPLRGQPKDGGHYVGYHCHF